MQFTIDSERGVETIEAESLFDAAGAFAADAAGFDSDELCFDPFCFAVDGVEFSAELKAVTGRGTGRIEVGNIDKVIMFDENGDRVR